MERLILQFKSTKLQQTNWHCYSEQHLAFSTGNSKENKATSVIYL